MTAYNAYLSTPDAKGFRPPTANLRAEPVRDLTGSGATYPPAQTDPSYSFKFAALASQSLSFEDDSQLCNDKSSTTATFAGTYDIYAEPSRQVMPESFRLFLILPALLRNRALTKPCQVLRFRLFRPNHLKLLCRRRQAASYQHLEPVCQLQSPPATMKQPL